MVWEVQRRLDGKTKPRKSLGRLEEICCAFAAACDVVPPPLPKKAIVVMGADHGVAQEGVSAYPAEVTAQMMLNFADGGAAISVLGRHAGAKVVVVDMGVATDLPARGGILVRKVAPGTQNFCKGPAMTTDQAIKALETGISIANDLADEGIGLIGLGEMGIGNSTSASALTSALVPAGVESVTGRGTGIDEQGLVKKIEVIRRGLAANLPESRNGLDAVTKLGGFEIAGLAGVVLGAAARRVPIVVDGFISAAAALTAVRMAPASVGYLLASHRSVEPGHRVILDVLGLKPVIEAEMRLGEGTGAALAMGIIEASLKILREMATFDGAKVTDTGK